MSRIVEFTSYGGPEVLKFKDVPDPQPAASEISIRVKAIGLNRAESMWRHGEYIEPVTLPARLGYEAAGSVEAFGKSVTGFKIGESVNVIPNFSMNEYATYGDLIVVPAGSVVKQPAALSFTEAASIWMMFITAYSALVEDAKVAKGDFVIVPADRVAARDGGDQHSFFRRRHIFAPRQIIIIDRLADLRLVRRSEFRALRYCSLMLLAKLSGQLVPALPSNDDLPLRPLLLLLSETIR